MNHRQFILLGLGLLPALLIAQTRDPSLYGRAYLAEGDHAGAIENYQEATRVNPFDPIALNNLGVARAAAGDYQAALDAFARANKLAPNRQDIAENYRQLQAWMDGQLRGNIAGRNPFAAEATPMQQPSSSLITEPPALWQRGTSKPQRNAVFQAADADTSMSFAPKKKKKSKKRHKEVICAPKVAE